MQQEYGNAGNDNNGDAGPHCETDRQIDDLQTLGEEEVTEPVKQDAQKTG